MLRGHDDGSSRVPLSSLSRSRLFLEVHSTQPEEALSEWEGIDERSEARSRHMRADEGAPKGPDRGAGRLMRRCRFLRDTAASSSGQRQQHI